MKVIKQNTSGTIGTGIMDHEDVFKPMMIIDRFLLKELAELMMMYSPRDYEIGTIEGPTGRKVLAMRPYKWKGPNSEGVFMLAEMVPVDDTLVPLEDTF